MHCKHRCLVTHLRNLKVCSSFLLLLANLNGHPEPEILKTSPIQAPLQIPYGMPRRTGTVALPVTLDHNNPRSNPYCMGTFVVILTRTHMGTLVGILIAVYGNLVRPE